MTVAKHEVIVNVDCHKENGIKIREQCRATATWHNFALVGSIATKSAINLQPFNEPTAGPLLLFYGDTNTAVKWSTVASRLQRTPY